MGKAQNYLCQPHHTDLRMGETRCWDAQMIQHIVLSTNLFNNYVDKRKVRFQVDIKTEWQKPWSRERVATNKVITRDSLGTCSMSKHHFSICITNAIQVRNLFIKDTCQWKDEYIQQTKTLRKLMTNQLSIRINYLHVFINRNKTTLGFYSDLKIKQAYKWLDLTTC